MHTIFNGDLLNPLLDAGLGHYAMMASILVDHASGRPVGMRLSPGEVVWGRTGDLVPEPFSGGGRRIQPAVFGFP